MPKFDVGDKVRMPGVPFTVEVLELGVCEDYEKGSQFCTWPETFRFTDPGGAGDDWAHTDEFEKVAR